MSGSETVRAAPAGSAASVRAAASSVVSSWFGEHPGSELLIERGPRSRREFWGRFHLLDRFGEGIA